jgi:hypothetical protein
MAHQGVYVKMEFGMIHSEDGGPPVYHINHHALCVYMFKDTGRMDLALRAAIKNLAYNQRYQAINGVKLIGGIMVNKLPRFTFSSDQAMIDAFLLSKEDLAEDLFLKAINGSSDVQAEDWRVINVDILSDVKYKVYKIGCDKNGNVGLKVVSKEDESFFSIPENEMIEGNAIDASNTFIVSERVCLEIKFNEIFSKSSEEPVYIVPPRAFAAMFTCEFILDKETIALFTLLFQNERYWAMPRRLPELEGACREESVSWAMHCLRITSLPDCSIRAPVKPDVVH